MIIHFNTEWMFLKQYMSRLNSDASDKELLFDDHFRLWFSENSVNGRYVSRDFFNRSVIDLPVTTTTIGSYRSCLSHCDTLVIKHPDDALLFKLTWL